MRSHANENRKQNALCCRGACAKRILLVSELETSTATTAAGDFPTPRITFRMGPEPCIFKDAII